MAMDRNETIPARLYKYRAFSECTVAMLVRDQLHFSDPRTFNDPLGAQPYLEIDVDESVLVSVRLPARLGGEEVSRREVWGAG